MRLNSYDKFNVEFPFLIERTVDYDIIFSTVDLWPKEIPEGYNSKTKDYVKGNGAKYKYSFADLKARKTLETSSRVLYQAIIKFETEGQAVPISVKDGSKQDFAHYGTDSALIGSSRYALNIGKAPVQAYMAYRILPQLIAELGIDLALENFLEGFSKKQISDFITGAVIEASMYYLANEICNGDIDWTDFTLDVIIAGFRNAMDFSKTDQARLACLQGVELSSVRFMLSNNSLRKKSIESLKVLFQCAIPFCLEYYTGSNPKLFKSTQRTAATKISKFLSKLDISILLKGKFLYHTYGLIETTAKRSQDWTNNLINILGSETGGEFLDLLQRSTYSVADLSKVSLTRLNTIVRKNGISLELENLLSKSLDVNRMLLYMDKCSLTPKQYEVCLKQITKGGQFEKTITINGTKMTESKFLTEYVDKSVFYYRKKGTKHFLVKFIEGSKVGVQVVVDDITKIILDVGSRVYVTELNRNFEKLKNEK